MKSKPSYQILHLISSGGLFGAERVLLEIAEGTQSLHCQAVVGVIESLKNRHLEIVNEARCLGLNVIVFPCSYKIGLAAILSISDFIKKNKTDLVHCHGYKSNLYGLLATRHTIPLLTTNHNWLTAHWKLKIYCFLDSLVMRCFDHIVAVSEDVHSDMLRAGISRKKMTVIDNGLNIKRLSPPFEDHSRIKAALHIPEENRVIGAIGGLKIEKGFSYLLKAAQGVLSSYKNVTFLFVGDGHLKKSLEEEASALGILDHVVFAGYRADIPQLISIMDLFVLSSIKEGLPMALLEAMAGKKPAIATRVGAVPKVIQDGQNGLLVPKEDVPALQIAICRLLSNKEEADRLALAGYDTVKKSYSSERL